MISGINNVCKEYGIAIYLFIYLFILFIYL